MIDIENFPKLMDRESVEVEAHNAEQLKVDADVAAFLAKGGKVESVPFGVSGQERLQLQCKKGDARQISWRRSATTGGRKRSEFTKDACL